MQVVLVLFRSDGERRSFSVVRDITVIGRREDCDLRIPLGDISRKHCRLIRDDDAVRLEDLGSSNGSFVNGQRVQEAVVQPGDTISVGPVNFVVQIDGVPSDDELMPYAAPTAEDTAVSGQTGVAEEPPAELEELGMAADDGVVEVPPAAEAPAEEEMSLDELTGGEPEAAEEVALEELAPEDELTAEPEAPVEELTEVEDELEAAEPAPAAPVATVGPAGEADEGEPEAMELPDLDLGDDAETEAASPGATGVLADEELVAEDDLVAEDVAGEATEDDDFIVMDEASNEEESEEL
ncbi:MAG TPA: FHA domain-containing protein, partial [Tepidisphaeraceae bacterium]|nr:FHA domain-containing protein [Tepidisphaeraceae bacterium]